MTYRPILAVLAALSVAAIVAIVTPRYSTEGEVSWLLTIGVGVAVAAVTLLVTREKTDAA